MIFKKKSQSGLLSRLNTIPKESSDNFSVYKKNYELEIITKMGYSSYFFNCFGFYIVGKKK